jgi:hypothetical protein
VDDVSSSSIVSTGPFRPSKIPSSIPQREEDNSDNPFIDHGPPKPDIPENPFAPIVIVSLLLSVLKFTSHAYASHLVGREGPAGSIYRKKASIWCSI